MGPRAASGVYFLRWRIRDRMRRFFRPTFLRPRPVFLTPTSNTSVDEFNNHSIS
jgi:hypothetical protein